MITLNDIQDGLDNGEIKLYELRRLVHASQAKIRTEATDGPSSRLRAPFVPHDSHLKKTRRAKDETAYSVTCQCGFLSRHWTAEQAIAAANKHDKFSGWRR